VRRLILIRHAMPRIDPNRHPSTWHLSSEGATQTLEFCERISHYELNKIYTSPEPKALETAAIMAEKYNVPLEKIDQLRDVDRNPQGYVRKSDYDISIRNFFTNPASMILGDETADDCYYRLKSVVDYLMSNDNCGNIVAVSHGLILSVFLSRVLKIGAFKIFNQLVLPSLIVLSIPDLKFVKGDVKIK